MLTRTYLLNLPIELTYVNKKVNCFLFTKDLPWHKLENRRSSYEYLTSSAMTAHMITRHK